MKTVFFSLLFTLLATSAYAMEQCDSTSKSEVAYEGDTQKITFIQGDIAKQAWNQMEVAATEPNPEKGNLGYYEKTKHSNDLNCWNYEAAKYLDGALIGPAGCDVYACNVIERK